MTATPSSATAIDATLLETVDSDDGPEELLYTLTAAPNAELQLDGVPLNVGDTFTQADINAGRLFYVHSGLPITDGFEFTVADPPNVACRFISRWC